MFLTLTTGPDPNPNPNPNQARRELERRQEAVGRREEAAAAGEVALGALDEAQVLATARCWAAELRDAEVSQ